MAGLKNITEREKAAIRYGLAYGVTNRVQLYKIAYDGTQEKLDSISDIRAVATRWYHSQKIREFIETERKEWEIRQQRIRSEIRVEVEAQVREEMRTGKRDKDGITDYSDPRNQLAKLNQIISTATDPAEALDALKVLISKQDQIIPEDTHKRKKNDAVRFYRPLSCTREENGGCPLYKVASETFRMLSGASMEGRTPAGNIRLLESLLDEKREELESFAVSWVERRIDYERKRLARWEAEESENSEK